MKVLVAKQLTFSDSSYDVSKCGRVVLPRAQVQECLVELLRGGGAHSAVASVKSSAPLRLAVELSVTDQHGRAWAVSLKTWQNMVSGQHRPTFVLENTAPFMRAHGLRQGSVLALCTQDGALQLRSDMALPTQGAGAPLPKATSPSKRRPTRPKSHSLHEAGAPTSGPKEAPVASPALDPMCPGMVEAAHVLVSFSRSDSMPSSTTEVPTSPPPLILFPGHVLEESDESAYAMTAAEAALRPSWSQAAVPAAHPRPAAAPMQVSPQPAAPPAYTWSTFPPPASAMPAGGRAAPPMGYPVTTGCPFPGSLPSMFTSAGVPAVPAPSPLARAASLPAAVGNTREQAADTRIVLSRQASLTSAPMHASITIAPSAAEQQPQASAAGAPPISDWTALTQGIAAMRGPRQ